MKALPQNWQTKSFFPWNEKQKMFGARNRISDVQDSRFEPAPAAQQISLRVFCIVMLVNQRCGSGSGKQTSGSGQHRIQNESDPKDWFFLTY
jgi:hypothetical protein